MERLRVRIATVAVAAAAVAGCFSDPAESLRNGPAQLRLTRTAAIVPIGDSVLVEANLLDDQGNILPATGATWSSDNPAVAEVAVAETQLPADGSTRAYIKGIIVAGGITYVRVSVQGISDSVRVTALPTAVLPPGTFAVTGTAQADTTSLGVAYTAGDTLTVNAPTGFLFHSDSSVVQLGGVATVLLSRTQSQIKVMAIQAHHLAPITVTLVTRLGDPAQGVPDIRLASLNSPENASIARARFRGTAVVAASAFGANTQLTLTAQAGTAFRTAAPLSTVSFGTAAGTIITRNATTIVVISPVAFNNAVKITNVDMGTVRFDSLFTTAAQNINPAFFPGTAVNGGGGMVDTIKIAATGGATLGTTGATASTVTINGQAAYIIRRRTDSIYAIARNNGTGPVTITNVTVGAATIASLNSSNSLNVGPGTGETNEPGNNAFATGTVVTAPAAVGDTTFYYGTFNGGSDTDDYIKFTAAATGQHRVIMDVGINIGVDADAIVMLGQFAGYACGGPNIVDGCAGATGPTAANQGTETTNFNATAATTYGVWTNMYDAHGATMPAVYRLRIIRIN